MRRFGTWLRQNADGFLALVIAGTIGLLGLLEVFGPDLLGTGEEGGEAVDAAILLVLALLAATLLRDRRHQARAVADANAVRLVHGSDIARLHADAHHGTDLWMFKGGTGSYLRAVTIKECVANARRAKRPMQMQIEIIDPTDDALCTEYAKYRSSLSPGPDGTGETWTAERARREAFATVLAACWYRERFTFLRVDLALSAVMTTFRWDLSSRWVIMTQEDPSAFAVQFQRDTPHYRSYDRELVASFDQARRVDVALVRDLRLSEEPSVDEARTLFTTLQLPLPESFTDDDVSDTLSRALQPKNPYG
ncbi:hypothetical protein [Actinoalloteichus fjordicus]|uniref:Uncharacterized protein n=1 Tax=Actinoalloteichus fjordicus TaxID=1612552 RepID=A0AAC9LBV9_9PSEU|nr:hypothetical protein [Actinoalloteichus fjordicus]APU14746.1 hypothetical protein UA74_13440 [Actinoalloteichus fjordicus]